MEDAVSAARAELLPGATEVRFDKIQSAAAGWTSGPAALALTATAVVIGPRDAVAEAADALVSMTDTVGLCTILISNDPASAATVRASQRAIALEGLSSEYVDNAVAALRLSSLPTMVWWRGGDPEKLGDLAVLADRLVLDAADPLPGWALVPALVEKTACSDLRWTRLTRWRALMAHFFDIAEIRAVAPSLRTLEIAGSDRHAARLFAGWLVSSLRWQGRVTLAPAVEGVSAPIQRVRFGDGDQLLTLELARGSCVEAVVHLHGLPDISRTVSLGDQGLRALIAEELRIRARDLPFEQALRAAGDIA
jgi:glucose-6-phosphate dehydrogenase assembly protein OpcA